MSPRCLSLPFLLAAVVGAIDLPAQRGGGSEEIRKRKGNYFVTVKLPRSSDTDGGKIALEATTLVNAAVKEGNLAFLYLYDPDQLPQKHKQFEQIMFGNAEINTALRCFQCGRVDLGENAHARPEFKGKTPLFVAFDAKGKKVGEVSIANYRPKASPLVGLLRKAHAGHAKMSLSNFVIGYRKFVRDFQIYEGRKKVLAQKRARLEQKSSVSAAKLKGIDKDEAELEVDLEKLLIAEKQMLEAAAVPTRDPKAELVGARNRGR